MIDNVERAKVDLIVHGDDVGLPFVTRSMLDLWVHALHGPNPFLIAARPGREFEFIQTYRNGPQDYTLEYRDGRDVEVMSIDVTAPAIVVDAIWAWIHHDRTRLGRLEGWEPVR